MTALLLLAACARPLPPAPDEPVDVQAAVESAKVASGDPVELEVRTWASEGWSVQLAPPQAEGLKVEEVEAEGPVQSGTRELWRHRYELTGPDGSYVVLPAVGRATDPDGNTRDLQAAPIFVDLGVPGPSAGELAGWEAPPPEGPPWTWIALGGAGALLLGGAVAALLLRGRKPAPPPPPDPPHVVARRRWEQARAAGLEDHPLAVALSQIFREYLEAVTGWPATARTTRETLRHFERAGRLGATDRLRAGRILDATDRLKFAREGGGQAFFVELDQDFDQVLRATSPREPADA